MINGKRVMVVIPARKGSKGLPNKNWKKLNGKPLISYSIELALKLSGIDKITISSDSDYVNEIVESYGLTSEYKRPAFLSLDDTRTEDTIIDVMVFKKKYKAEEFDIILLLEPTSPLRKIELVHEIVNQLASDIETREAVISIGLSKIHPVTLLQKKVIC
jgi:CMP-N-acetylneuraminic acid synthetase